MKDLDGGFSSFREITKEEKQMFDDVLKGFVGVGRVPLAIATQVVSGMNYAFGCESKVIVPEALPYNDIVIIYKPLNGEPILKQIEEIDIL